MRREWINKLYDLGDNVIRFTDKQEALLDKNSPQYLYQYRSVDEYNLENIKNGVIWGSKADCFNDPYDCLFSSDALDELVKRAIDNKRQAFIPRIEYVENELSKVSQDIRDKIVVSCFSERNDSLLMWSHYADQHKGICVTYDYNKLVRLCQRLIRPVRYGNKISTVYLDKNRRKRDIGEILITKAIDWSYEQEWRVIDTIQPYEKDTTKNCKGKTIEAPVPEKIIFGSKVNMKDNIVKDFINYCVDQNIKCTQMCLDNNVFKLIENDLSIK